jgi:hypothetical protein
MAAATRRAKECAQARLAWAEVEVLAGVLDGVGNFYPFHPLWRDKMKHSKLITVLALTISLGLLGTAEAAGKGGGHGSGSGQGQGQMKGQGAGQGQQSRNQTPDPSLGGQGQQRSREQSGGWSTSVPASY